MRPISHVSVLGYRLAAGLVGAACLAATALAQVPKPTPAPKDPGAAKEAKELTPRLGSERSESYYVGLLVSAEKGTCRDISATLPVPFDWPEQTVKVLKEDKSSHVKRLEYVLVGGGVRQM